MTTDVEVWEGDLFLGALPPICAVSGEPTNGRYPVRYSTTPRWVILLIFFGIVPFIVAWLLTRRVATGFLPMTPRARRRTARDDILRPVLLVVELALLVAASIIAAVVAPGSAGAVVLVGALALVTAWTITVWWLGRVGIKGYVGESTPWGRAILLADVHPIFAAAVEAMYATRRSPGSPAPPPPPVLQQLSTT